MRPAPVTDRLWKKVRRGEPSECWLFIGKVIRGGYGRISVPSGVPEKSRMVSAHRVAYQSAHGPIPDGMSVCHRCDVPLCCNPAHLFVGTQAENNRDRDVKGRQVGPHGEKNGNRRFSEPQVVGMLRLHASGLSLAEIAWLFDTNKSSVSDICRGRTWAHLEERRVG